LQPPNLVPLHALLFSFFFKNWSASRCCGRAPGRQYPRWIGDARIELTYVTMASMSYTGKRYDFHDKPADYARLHQELAALLAGERDLIANAANTCALIFDALPDLNWAGFYFLKGGELVVGPFQGKPACVRIALGRGVCGTAAVRRRTLLVPDVHEFPGHIPCDTASRSEIVVPLIAADQLLGVLDIDSPRPGRFDEADARGLESLAGLFMGLLGQAAQPSRP
jgi:L-methionine (R)-S-oxide reductase